MASKIQWKNLDEIRVEVGKKWEKNCETKYGVVEKIQNQNGVIVFSNLKDATKVVLVKLDMNNIGYLLHT